MGELGVTDNLLYSDINWVAFGSAKVMRGLGKGKGDKRGSGRRL